jgi:hypothetical protein
MQNIKTEPVKTILIIVLGLLILYIKLQLNWVLYIALTLAAIGVLSNRLSNKIEFLWMKFAWILSLIVPKILLTLVFYLFLFPMAIVTRIVGVKNGIIIKNNRKSFFEESNKPFDKASFEKPW